ncbi:MAG: hypothetical protein HPY60_11845 [Candidatus Methanofastidiosum sp.]|nr:hypothetical protein [Methanofastidiosum sp.]
MKKLSNETIQEIFTMVKEITKSYHPQEKDTSYITRLVLNDSNGIEGFKTVWSKIEENEFKFHQVLDVYRYDLWLKREIDAATYNATDNYLYRGYWHPIHKNLHGYTIINQNQEQILNIKYDGRKKAFYYQGNKEPFKLYDTIEIANKTLEILNLYNEICDSGMTLSVIPCSEVVEHIGENHNYQSFCYKFYVKDDFRSNIKEVIASIKEKAKQLDLKRYNLIWSREPYTKKYQPLYSNKKCGDLAC